MNLIEQIDYEIKKRGMLTTLMSTIINRDEQGRPLNPDMNYVWGQCKIADKIYTKIIRGWDVYYFEGVKNYLSYNDGTHFHKIDITPDYIKVKK